MFLGYFYQFGISMQVIFDTSSIQSRDSAIGKYIRASGLIPVIFILESGTIATCATSNSSFCRDV